MALHAFISSFFSLPLHPTALVMPLKVLLIGAYAYALLMSRNNIPFLRLDGTLNQQQREKVIKQFSEDSKIMVCGKIFFWTKILV